MESIIAKLEIILYQNYFYTLNKVFLLFLEVSSGIDDSNIFRF